MILITGGMGFIGLHTARQFVNAGEQVVLTVNRSRRAPAFLEGEYGTRVFIERLDVTNPLDFAALGRAHRITGIVHMASPGVGALGAPPVQEFQTNLQGLLNVLEFAKTWGVRRVSLASSIAVYRGLPEGPFREGAWLPVESRTPIEAYKKTWENLGQHYARQIGLDLVSIRIGSIWGPLFYQTAPQLAMRAIMLTCQAAVRGETPDYGAHPGGMPAEGDGSDLCYVTDCARGVQLLHSAEKLNHTVYNLAAGRFTTMGEIAEAVRRVIPTAVTPLRPGKSPTTRPKAYLDISRAREDAGYLLEWPLDRAIPDYLAWLRANAE